MSIIDELLKEKTLITTNIRDYQLKFVLKCLSITLEKNVLGDVVEFGCHDGTNSLFIRHLLNIYNSDKQFFVYDSFERLPEKTKSNQGNTCLTPYEESLVTEEKQLIQNFKNEGLELPVINKVCFADIPDDKYPEKISFAFFNGNFIIDSFTKTYHKLSPHSIICIHNYNYTRFPGVRKFLADKPEAIFASRDIGYMVKE